MREEITHDFLQAFRGKRILIIGDVMLDEYIWGDVHRISPEAPVPIVEYRHRTFVPGGAGNTAANILSLGGQVLLGGAVGEDSQGRQLRTALTAIGIAANGLVVDPQRPTTTKTRIVAHNQQLIRLDSESCGPLAADFSEALLIWAAEQMEHADACVLSDYAKGVVSAHVAGEFIGRARRAGLPVVVDPKGQDYAKYRSATVVKPNLHEAERFCQWKIHDEPSLIEAGRHLISSLDGGAVLLTRGPAGMILFREGVPPLYIDSVARAVSDVTGAGDTVVGTLALALAAGATLDQAACLANMAAGVVVGKVGTSTISLEELIDAI